MKLIMKKAAAAICTLLVFSVAAICLGTMKAQAYTNYPATGVFKLEICTKDKTIMYPAPGSDSDFEFRLLNSSQQILWQSGTLDTPANDFEEGHIDVFTAQTGNPALGAVPVSKDIYYFEIIETEHNDSWFMNWLDVYYLVDSNWVLVAHNGGDYELDHVGDHVRWSSTWFADHNHTLNFNTNGGTNAAIYDAVYGQPLTAPTTTKTGYNLVGWSPSLPAVMPDSNATFTAQWAGNNYTVNFLANGLGASTPSPTSKTVTYGSTYGTLATTSRTGYTFTGWYTDAAGGTKIESTTTVSITANQTLYAHWTGNPYEVTFDPNGGSAPSPASKTVTYGSTYGTLATTSRAGYTFTGWYTAAGGGTKIESTATVSTAADQTLYAHWMGNSYQVTFNPNGGDTPSPASKTVTYGSAYGALAAVSRTGYSFNGWYTAVSGGTKIEPASMVTIPSNHVLCAQWSINSYNITFAANGGVFPETGNGNPVVYSMFYGDYIFPPAVAKTGCCFGGWSPDVPKYVPAADQTYTAQWRTAGYAAGNAFFFGDYPQSAVRDTSLLLKLRECQLDENNTVTYEGERYLRVCFEQYTPYFLGLTPNEANSLQDNNGYYATAEYWFKYEPIQWRVLSNINGEIFAVAETILDSGPFSPSAGEWAGSAVRTWLNDSFAGVAFLPDEWARINSSEVLVPANPALGTPGGTTTQDKLFFLSYEEAMDSSHGFTGSADSDANRRAGVTEYARCMGLLEEEQTYGHGLWWLRSPGFSSTEAGVVTATGSILAQDSYHAAYTCVGIRPAMRIDAMTLILFPVKGSGCVIDYANKFIYGLSPGIATLDGYAATAEGYVLEYAPTSEGFGTGTKVHVKKDGVTVDTYTIVIFGDVNGDGNIDTSDAGIIVDYENFMVLWDQPEDAVYLKAADLNGDGNVDTADAGIIVDFENFMLNINQTTGLAE